MITRPTTKEILAESLKELSASKPVDKITIKEIVQNCGVTPRTFYNHFQDKYDLIAWIYSTDVRKIMSRIYDEDCTWRDVLVDAFAYFVENKDFLKNLMIHTSGQDSFINYAANFSIKLFSNYIKRTQNLETLPYDLEIFIRVYSYGAVCTFCEMLIKPLPISNEEFVRYIDEALPEPLKKYLYKN